MKLKLSTAAGLMFGCFFMLIYPTLMMLSTTLTISGYTVAAFAGFQTIKSIVSLCLTPVFGKLVDKGYCRVPALLLIMSMLGGTIYFFSVDELTNVRAICYMLFTGVASGAYMSLSNNWIVKLGKQTGEIDYSKARACGSIAFAFISIIYGSLTSAVGIRSIPILTYILLAVQTVCTFLLPDPESTDIKETTEKVSLLKNPLFHNKSFIIFCLINSLSSSVVSFTDDYIPVLILGLGGSTIQVGMYDFCRCILEFFAMRQFTKLSQRFGSKKLLAAGYLGFFLKGFITSLMPTSALVVCCSVLQTIAFPLTEPGRVSFLQSEIDIEHLAMAMSLSSVISSVISSFVINPITAVLISRLGVAPTMKLNSILSLVACVGFSLLLMKDSNNKSQPATA